MAGDGRHACAAARPAHLATAMDPTLGADGERAESRVATNGFGSALVETDITVWHALGIHGKDPAKKRMHCEVPALHPMIQAGVKSKVVAMLSQRLKKARQLVVLPAFLGKNSG